jgi:TRAP-type C4-dicarboxylate transport system permease small subunit
MLASRADQHISIDLVQRQLPAEWQRRVRVLIKLFTAAVCFLAAYYCLQFVQMEYADGNLAFGQIPLWLVEAIMPFAFAAMGVRYVLQAAGIGPQGTPS